jgi:glyoxylase I family protein
VIRVREIDHLVLRVVDLEAMLRFYCDVLGCTVERRQETLGLVQLRAGRSLLDLVPVDGKLGRAGGAAPGREGRNLDHFCFRVEPFDEAAIRSRLAVHGVPVGPIASRYGAEGEGPSVYVTDPEGNVVELKGPPRGAPVGPTAAGEPDPGRFQRWLDGYGQAWMTGDPQAAVQLFTPSAAYHETPFDSPMVGAEAIRRYWTEGAKNAQTDVQFEATPLWFDGTTGVARWRATFRRVPSMGFVELDGTLLARFDDEMRCEEFREWWHRRES